MEEAGFESSDSVSDCEPERAGSIVAASFAFQ